MSYGFIYYATNPSMPGVTKIGMTTKHPYLRLAELASATACPEPFELLAFFDTPSMEDAEREIHKQLAEYRVNNRREFFRAPLAELQDQARRWGDPQIGCFVMRVLDYLLEQEDAAQMTAEETDSMLAYMEAH